MRNVQNVGLGRLQKLIEITGVENLDQQIHQSKEQPRGTINLLKFKLKTLINGLKIPPKRTKTPF